MGGEAEEQQVVGLLSRAGPWLSSLPAPLGLDLGGCQTGLTLPSLETRKKNSDFQGLTTVQCLPHQTPKL